MTTVDFITELFCRVDDAMSDVQKHSQASLCPSETVTLGLLYALKGGSGRAFHRWAERDLAALFPRLPERTRLFRLLAAHQDWPRRFLGAPLPGRAASWARRFLGAPLPGRAASWPSRPSWA